MITNLKFHVQASAAVKKANQILGLIKRTIATKNEKTIPLLYMSLVRPHREYANVVWGPHYKGDQQLVEKVQRRATKIKTPRYLKDSFSLIAFFINFDCYSFLHWLIKGMDTKIIKFVLSIY